EQAAGVRMGEDVSVPGLPEPYGGCFDSVFEIEQGELSGAVEVHGNGECGVTLVDPDLGVGPAAAGGKELDWARVCGRDVELGGGVALEDAHATACVAACSW